MTARLTPERIAWLRKSIDLRERALGYVDKEDVVRLELLGHIEALAADAVRYREALERIESVTADTGRMMTGEGESWGPDHPAEKAHQIAVAALARDNDKEGAWHHNEQDYRRNYGKGAAMDVAKRVIDMCTREFGKVGLGVLEQRVACDVQAMIDAKLKP